MDKQTAKSKLKELRDSLSEILDGKSYQDSEDITEQSQEIIEQARSASSSLKKSLVEKIKDLPVVQKVSELGTAGSVAVSTAAVAQTSVAVDQTEVFVASVANDVVEQRIEVPMFIDTFVDFHVLNDWGQIVIAEKVAAVSELPQISEPAAASSGTTQETAPSSHNSSSENSSQSGQQQQTDKSSEQKSQGQESKGESSSKDNGSQEDNKGKQEPAQEQKTESKTGTQESNASSESEANAEPVKSEIPIVQTPIDTIDDIKPHPIAINISPTN